MEVNLGWLFYKDYFNDINYNNIKSNIDNIKRKSEIILNYSFNKSNFVDIGNVHLDFKTTYPGLLIGSGHLHEIKDLEGQLILGFQFDYTTGLPIIPASSIKGVLRSIFAKEDTGKKIKKENLEFIKKQLESVFDLIKKENNIEIDENYIINLEKELFESDDIFFDGEIIEGDSENKILADDFITPHKDNHLKNPIPLRFVKVRPEVKFRFSFKLKDSEELSFNIEQKTLFFEKILVFLGIGAKTNVGYGQLIGTFQSDLEKEIEENKKKQIEQEHEKKIQEEISRKNNLSPYELFLEEHGNKEIAIFIQAMQSFEKENKEKFDEIKKDLAEFVKVKIQEKNDWKNPKKKALDRKIYIEKILNN